MANDLDKPSDRLRGTEGLFHSLRELIQSARREALRAVDAVQVQTCWEIGRHLVEFEQGGATVLSTALGSWPSPSMIGGVYSWDDCVILFMKSKQLRSCCERQRHGNREGRNCRSVFSLQVTEAMGQAFQAVCVSCRLPSDD
jgi:hypothetical protein